MRTKEEYIREGMGTSAKVFVRHFVSRGKPGTQYSVNLCLCFSYFHLT